MSPKIAYIWSKRLIVHEYKLKNCHLNMWIREINLVVIHSLLFSTILLDFWNDLCKMKYICLDMKIEEEMMPNILIHTFSCHCFSF